MFRLHFKVYEAVITLKNFKVIKKIIFFSKKFEIFSENILPRAILSTKSKK